MICLLQCRRFDNDKDNVTENTYAAVDLGSNSFHMLLARMDGEQLQVLDRLKEMIRLAGGLDEKGMLTESAQDKAIACLERMGQRLKDVPTEQLRVVGTNTLRKAKNARVFLARAEQALGHRIEVISGREEARLLYLGVAHSLPSDQGKRLVVDIGGGSTELIIGEAFDAKLRESLHMGCVSMTRKYFSDGKISKSSWKKAVTHALLEFRPLLSGYHKKGWSVAVGASGSMRSTATVLKENGWSEQGITRSGLQLLKKYCLDARKIEKLNSLQGLISERQPVFIGGAVIIYALFEAFELEKMEVSTGALREGVIYDLSGRHHHKDIRARSIEFLAEQFHIDQKQVGRVKGLLEQILLLGEKNLALTPDERDLLFWAAELHELGLSIAHNQFHKHGAYLIEHADTPGFSNQEQLQLAFLIHAQRRKFPTQLFKDFSEKQQLSLLLLTVLLRIALVLRRDRSELDIKLEKIKWNGEDFTVGFAPDWLENHPLYYADLQLEAGYLKAAGVVLKIDH